MMNIRTVISQLQREKQRLSVELNKVEQAIEALESMNGNNRGKIARRTRNMSAAGRQRIIAAQRARWAKWRAQHSKKAA
jgi:prefoldin subunit 5